MYLASVRHWWAVLNPHRNESLRVLGQHRKSRDWIVSFVRSTYVEDWRVRVVYKPAVLSRLKEELPIAFNSNFDWEGDRDTREAVSALLKAWGLPTHALIRKAYQSGRSR